MSTQFTNRQWRLPNNENKDKQSNYSMDFDSASSDYIGTSQINLGLENTISLWCKRDGADFNGVLLGGSSASGNYTLRILSNEAIYYRIGSTFPVPEFSIVTELQSDEWVHIAVVRNNSGADLVLYVNGQLRQTLTNVNNNTNDTIIQNIGARATGDLNITGFLDAVSFFNYALSSSQVTTLYGSSSTGIGNPMSLSPKPVAYYQLGDKSAFNGADYLVPNIAAEEADGDIATSYSPYALDFDSASSDYISLNSVQSLTGEFSISIWVKPDGLNFSQVILGNNAFDWIRLNSTNEITFRINGNNPSSENFNAISGNNLVSYAWQHLLFIRDSSDDIRIYRNGSLFSNNAYNQAAAFSIGKIASRTGVYYNGEISNVSIWNTALTSAQVTEIYNEGVPSNLNNHSAYSNLVSWWQLGSNSSFNTNWTVLDEKGSNNGTSVNMGEDAIVDGVGSYANGLSSGMGGDEVIGDAPYSTANSLSVNMDVEDRVTDTPS